MGGGRWGEHILPTPKYLDQFLPVLHATFTTGLVFARQLKQGAATPCFDQSYRSLLCRLQAKPLSIGQDHGIFCP